MIDFDVLGVPAPKGSGRAVLIGGKARHIASGSDANARKMRGWDAAVREAAARAVGVVDAPPFVGAALKVRLVFHLARPGGHWGKRGLKPSAPPYPASKPDLDKLVRATLDALTGIVFDDDARLVDLVALKLYAQPGREGARIAVEAARREACEHLAMDYDLSTETIRQIVAGHTKRTA